VDRAQGALDREQPDEAWKMASAALGYAPDDAIAKRLASISLFRVGEGHLQRRRVDAALSSFRKMLTYDDGGEARQALTNILFEAELWKPAIEFFRQWSAQDPSDQSARHNLMAVLHNAGLQDIRNENWDGAIGYLEEALRTEDTPATRKSLAQAYAGRAFHRYRMGIHDGAKNDLATALKYDPSNGELRRMYRSL